MAPCQQKYLCSAQHNSEGRKQNMLVIGSWGSFLWTTKVYDSTPKYFKKDNGIVKSLKKIWKWPDVWGILDDAIVGSWQSVLGKTPVPEHWKEKQPKNPEIGRADCRIRGSTHSNHDCFHTGRKTERNSSGFAQTIFQVDSFSRIRPEENSKSMVEGGVPSRTY